MQEVKSEDYKVWYDSEESTLYCQGSLRLSGMDEYAPIIQLLNEIVEEEPPAVVLNLRQLEFLNSSGISILSRFVIKVRQQKTMQMTVQGSNSIPWQKKSLKNLQRLMPSLSLELV